MMERKYTFLETEGFDLDELCEMDEITFIDGEGKKILVFHQNEFLDYCKSFMLHELPYLSNNFLQKYLKPQFRNEVLLSEIKEHAKFEPSLILEKLNVPQNLFWLDFLKEMRVNEIEKLFFDECKIIESKYYNNIFAICEN